MRLSLAQSYVCKKACHEICCTTSNRQSCECNNHIFNISHEDDHLAMLNQTRQNRIVQWREMALWMGIDYLLLESLIFSLLMCILISSILFKDIESNQWVFLWIQLAKEFSGILSIISRSYHSIWLSLAWEKNFLSIFNFLQCCLRLDWFFVSSKA